MNIEWTAIAVALSFVGNLVTVAYLSGQNTQMLRTLSGVVQKHEADIGIMRQEFAACKLQEEHRMTELEARCK